MVIYAVCHSLQAKEIKEYCFNKCGEIIIGGIDFNDMAWCPCRTELCLYVDREASFGEAPFDWGKEELIGRKLIPLSVSPEVDKEA